MNDRYVIWVLFDECHNLDGLSNEIPMCRFKTLIVRYQSKNQKNTENCAYLAYNHDDLQWQSKFLWLPKPKLSL